MGISPEEQAALRSANQRMTVHEETSGHAYPVEQVTWPEVEDAAPILFNVWVGNPEVAWARQAWKALRRAGLTSYRDQLEKQRVLIRLMVLAVVYLEFCDLAWDESRSPWVGDWVYELKVSPFRVGQLLGPDFVSEWDDDDDDLVRNAVEELIVEERPGVIRALEAYYGDRQELFVALMGSANPMSAGKRPGPIARGRILNDPDAVGLLAYEWVMSGMAPQWHPTEEW